MGFAKLIMDCSSDFWGRIEDTYFVIEILLHNMLSSTNAAHHLLPPFTRSCESPSWTFLPSFGIMHVWKSANWNSIFQHRHESIDTTNANSFITFYSELPWHWHNCHRHRHTNTHRSENNSQFLISIGAFALIREKWKLKNVHEALSKLEAVRTLFNGKASHEFHKPHYRSTSEHFTQFHAVMENLITEGSFMSFTIGFFSPVSTGASR